MSNKQPGIPSKKSIAATEGLDISKLRARHLGCALWLSKRNTGRNTIYKTIFNSAFNLSSLIAQGHNSTCPFNASCTQAAENHAHPIEDHPICLQAIASGMLIQENAQRIANFHGWPLGKSNVYDSFAKMIERNVYPTLLLMLHYIKIGDVEECKKITSLINLRDSDEGSQLLLELGAYTNDHPCVNKMVVGVKEAYWSHRKKMLTELRSRVDEVFKVNPWLLDIPLIAKQLGIYIPEVLPAELTEKIQALINSVPGLSEASKPIAARPPSPVSSECSLELILSPTCLNEDQAEEAITDEDPVEEDSNKTILQLQFNIRAATLEVEKANVALGNSNNEIAQLKAKIEKLENDISLYKKERKIERANHTRVNAKRTDELIAMSAEVRRQIANSEDMNKTIADLEARLNEQTKTTAHMEGIITRLAQVNERLKKGETSSIPAETADIPTETASISISAGLAALKIAHYARSIGVLNRVKIDLIKHAHSHTKARIAINDRTDDINKLIAKNTSILESRVASAPNGANELISLYNQHCKARPVKRTTGQADEVADEFTNEQDKRAKFAEPDTDVLDLEALEVLAGAAAVAERFELDE